MKHKQTILFLFLLILFTTQAYSQWDIFIGYSGTKEIGLDVIETYDRGYLFLANQEGNKTIVTKTNVNGEVLWQKIFFSEENFYPWQIIETSDYGYVIIGDLIVYGISNIIIQKFNSCIEKEWCRVIHKDGVNNISYSIIENTNNTLLLLTHKQTLTDPIGLYGITLNGNFLWENNYVTNTDYPELENQLLFDLMEVENEYYFSGLSYIQDGKSSILKPLLVGVDSEFNEKWVNPYGNLDQIGAVNSVSSPNSNDLYFMGECRNISTNYSMPLVIKLNESGEELGYYYVENDSIQIGNKVGIISEIDFVDNGKIISGGTFNSTTDPYASYLGFIVFDTLGNVYNYKDKTDIKSPNGIKIISESMYLESGTYKPDNGDWDAYLHKHDANLDPAPINNDSIVYDYLCPFDIESGEIVLDDCVIVGIEDLPTPKEYYTSIATIPIWIYPNPASNIVHFAMENTEHHKNITLQVFDLNGRPIIQQSIQKGQKEATTNVSNWQSGMYAVVVFSDGKVVGKEKFVVR